MRLDTALAFHVRRVGEPVPPVPIAAYLEHFTNLTTAHGIRVEWLRDSSRGSSARPKLREVFVQPFRDETSIAGGFHEAAHVIAGECTGALHYRDPKERRYLNCLRCETLAWAIAIAAIKPLPWSRRMHESMTHALASYRRTTAGPDAAKQQLDALASPLEWFCMQQRAVAKTLPNSVTALSERLARSLER